MGVFPLIWSGELRDWRIRSEVEERLVLAVVHLRNQDRTADRSAKRVGVADGSIPADLVRGVEGLAHQIPVGAAMEVVRATAAGDGQVGGLRELRAVAGGVHSKLGDAFY